MVRKKRNRASSIRETPQKGGAKSYKRSLALHLILGAVLLGSVMLVYSNNYANSFVYDDIRNIIDNPRIHSLLRTLPKRPVELIKSRRWVVNFTLAINYKLSGMSVWSYHLFNNLLHGINVLLVYSLFLIMLRRYSGTGPPANHRGGKNTDSVVGASLSTNVSDQIKMQVPAAFGAAMLFGVHTIQTQAVNYIIQRAELLSTFFFLAAFLSYIRLADEKKWSLRAVVYCLLVLTAFIFALGSKPHVVVFPAIILMYEFIPKAGARFGVFLSRLKTLSVPLILTGVLTFISVSGLFRAQVERGYQFAGFGVKTIGPAEYLYTQFNVIVTYLRLLIFPVGLNLDYDYPVSHSLFSFPTVISFPVLLVIGVTAVLMMRKYRLISFFALWFFVVLAPTSSFIPIVDVIHEHRLYLPSVAFCFVLAMLVFRISDKRRIAAISVLAIVVLLNGIGTFQRNYTWRDSITMWNDVIIKSPNKARGYVVLGNEYMGKLAGASAVDKDKYFRLAFENTEKAIKLDPNQPAPHNNIALMYIRMGELQKAIEHFESAIEADPFFPGTYYNMAGPYLKAGKQVRALELIKNAIDANPDDEELYLRLGFLYEHNSEGIHYGPGMDLDKAEEAYRKSVEIKPDYAEGYLNLGALYQKRKDYATAKKYMEKYLLYQKNDPRVKNVRRVIKSWEKPLK